MLQCMRRILVRIILHWNLCELTTLKTASEFRVQNYQDGNMENTICFLGQWKRKMEYFRFWPWLKTYALPMSEFTSKVHSPLIGKNYYFHWNVCNSEVFAGHCFYLLHEKESQVNQFKQEAVLFIYTSCFKMVLWL